MKILVTDDSKTMRYLVQQNLRAMGIPAENIVLCESGEKAIEILQCSTIDFALLDWHMTGMSGVDVLKKIRAELSLNIPVIMLTTEQKRKNIQLAVQTGADDYIIKPLDAPRFRKKILATARKYGLNVHTAPQSSPLAPPKEEIKKEKEKLPPPVSESDWHEVKKTIASLEESGKLEEISDEDAEDVETLMEDERGEG